MKRDGVELIVGIFVLAGVVCLAHLSIGLAKHEVIHGPGYELKAVFSDVGGLRPGAAVTIAGVEVGRVNRIELSDYQALVIMMIDADVPLQADAMASIRTRGLIGEKFVSISPGGDENMLKSGDEIFETEPAVDIEQLISKFVFGKKS